VRRDAERFCAALPGRIMIGLGELWRVLNEVSPGLAGGADLRVYLAELLNELEQGGLIALPKGKKSYDYAGTVALPLMIRRLDLQRRRERLGARVWSPELVFLSSQALTPDTPWLAVDAWLKATAGQTRSQAPVRERSLEIFGHDKALDDLIKQRPFAEGLISHTTLGCYQVPMPLAARIETDAPPIALVVENLATYDSIARANSVRKSYRAVVFGHGNAFATGWEGLMRIRIELGILQCRYFGDMDGLGLSIPFRVANAAGDEFLSLASNLYVALVAGRIDSWCPDGSRLDTGAEAWARGKLPELDVEISRVASGKRLPQEWLTLSWLQSNL